MGGFPTIPQPACGEASCNSFGSWWGAKPLGSRVPRTISGWWFQPPWKILVRLDHHPNYWGKKKCSKPPTRYTCVDRCGTFSVQYQEDLWQPADRLCLASSGASGASGASADLQDVEFLRFPPRWIWPYHAISMVKYGKIILHWIEVAPCSNKPNYYQTLSHSFMLHVLHATW